MYAAECHLNRNQILLNTIWSPKKVFAYQLEMEQTTSQWSCRHILELVFEVWKVLRQSDQQTLPSTNSRAWRNCFWSTGDGVIKESPGWYVITFTKTSCWPCLKFTLRFITDILVKSYLWTGCQPYTTLFLPHMPASSRFLLNRMQRKRTLTNIQYSTVLGSNTSIST